MADKSEERLLCADDHAVEGRLLSLEVKIASLPMLRDLTRVAFWDRCCRHRHRSSGDIGDRSPGPIEPVADLV